LSGTGPKAGGPWALHRLRRDMSAPAPPLAEAATPPPALAALRTWAEAGGRSELASRCATLARSSPLMQAVELPGPTGESNRLRFIGRGQALCIAGDEDEVLHQIAAALAAGNRVALAAPGAAALAAQLPEAVRRLASVVHDISSVACDVALCPPAQASAVRRALAAGSGSRVRVVTPNGADGEYPPDALVAEQTLTVNTAAAGGNAGLMTLAPA
jgi:RHH-type proline utilization regulon transcriptional repressor/proline dehydrogenase/delta 1-pyrroline-5-carboxylate dehydrogenase